MISQSNICLLLTISALALSSALKAETVYQSPSGTLKSTLTISETGRLTYEVTRGGHSMIEPSSMGVTIDGIDLGQQVALGEATTESISDPYPIKGAHTQAKNIYRRVLLPVTQNTSGIKYDLEMRLYDEGFAWRYLVPGKGSRTVHGEASAFRIPEKTQVWYFERKNAWKLKSYAGEWMSAPIEAMPKVSRTPLQGFPLILEYPHGGYGVLCEAAVFNYSGMRVEAIGDRTFRANFTEGDAGFQLNDQITTPWRSVIAVDTLNELVNQTMVTNLAPAPDPILFADQSWIKPDWCVWRWQLQGIGLPSDQQTFIKYAKSLGYPYTLIDDGWEYDWEKPWEKLKELCAYAEKEQVKVFVWKRWADVANPENNFAELRNWLDQVAATGTVGVKLDFFDAEDLTKRLGEEAVLREAAKRKLMVNFHGCPKPSGESRTYPNEVTREGIRGLELNFIRSEGLLPPQHNAALPFTRLVLGHGDYTPVTFQPGHMGETTAAHQLATAVIMTSPMQVLNEIPSNVIYYPIQEVTTFLKNLPTYWDETIVLPESKIGDLAVLARRKGDHWYLGALNGGPDREYHLDLNLLGETPLEGFLISDSQDSQLAVKVVNIASHSESKIKIQISKGGGFVAQLKKK